MIEKKAIQLFIRLLRRERREYQDTDGKCDGLFYRILKLMRRSGRK